MDKIFIHSLHNYIDYCRHLHSDYNYKTYLQTKGIGLVQNQKFSVKFTKSPRDALFALDDLVYNK